MALQCDPADAFAEANELRIGACPRREALRADMQRLEQIRLPRSVRSDDQQQAGLELEVKSGVRANVPKRDSVDDQTVPVLPWQPDRHDQVRRVVLAALDNRGAKRRNQT